MALKLTKSSVDALPYRTSGQKLYMDTELKGFGVLVSKKAKTYVAQRDVNGKTVRVTIGRHGVVTTSNARAEAMTAINQMRVGVNPNKARDERTAQKTTLADAAELYLGANKARSPKTIGGFKDAMRLHFPDWQKKPLAEITRPMVKERHKRIGEKSGPYAANSAMRALRSAWNRMMRECEDLPVCPTINVDWYEESPRDAAIPAEKLAEWYEGVMKLPNPVRRDYFLFVLFSGLRRTSAAEIQWQHVDLDETTLRIPSPKGGPKRAFVLPLSKTLVQILIQRKEENEQLAPNSPWVFPAERSKSGHIEEPKLSSAERKVVTVPFTVHGLRHTWVTAANAAGISPYDIQMLANHAPPKGSVTAGYIGAHIDALRLVQDRIACYIETLMT